MYPNSKGGKSKSLKTCLLTFRCGVQHLHSIDLQRWEKTIYLYILYIIWIYNDIALKHWHVCLYTTRDLSPFIISDTFSFLEELRASNFDTNNIFMANFDINSLLTNVPLDEPIDIVNKAIQNATLYHGFSVFQLGKLLSLAVNNGHFLFNNSLYEQVDGVALGSPLGTLFANMFLAFHEGSWLTNCLLEFQPLFFRCYIDNCFVNFRSRNHVRPFLDYLNSQHPNIKFTSELETDSTLPFLDTLIDHSDGFSTSVYRKSTFTGLFTNFDSLVPLSYKRGICLWVEP